MRAMQGNDARREEIERELRLAQATQPDPVDSWLNGYRDDVAYLLAALEDAERERDRLRHNVRSISRNAERMKSERDAAEARARLAEDALAHVRYASFIQHAWDIANAALVRLDGETAQHPCPKGDGCALNKGAVHCKHCGRNWPPDDTWRDGETAPAATEEGET